MPKSFTPPTEFRPELGSTLRSILDNAVNQIDIANRTSATKAKMAERIPRAASDRITDPAILTAMAIDIGVSADSCLHLRKLVCPSSNLYRLG
jgi:hypothetical protein